MSTHKEKSLIVFVHIPKTAGSTVNRALNSFSNGEDHCEKYLHDLSLFKKIACEKDWISGHLHVNKFQELLHDLDREIKLFTTMRSPVAQVRSHLNWLIEIYYKGASFYDSHPPQIKEISEDIRGCNRSDPESIVLILEKYKGLFMNCQSKFIFGTSTATINDLNSDALDKFEFISNEKNLDTMFNLFSKGLGYNERNNVSKYHFDPKIFESNIIHDFLSQENTLDNLAYKMICERFNS